MTPRLLVSVKNLAEAGVIFMPISEAVHEHPDLVKKYLSSVVPVQDNYYAALNSAVFSDGSFVYIPKGVRCPMELSTYFRINAKNTIQHDQSTQAGSFGTVVISLGLLAAAFDSSVMAPASPSLPPGRIRNRPSGKLKSSQTTSRSSMAIL